MLLSKKKSSYVLKIVMIFKIHITLLLEVRGQRGELACLSH